MKQRLSEYLPDLLTHFECVIIPEFGGFVVQNFSTPTEGLAGSSPKIKKVIFNSNLNHNDGLLANYIAQTENISYQEAMLDISEEREKLFESLEAGNIIKVAALGELRLLNDRIIFKSYAEDSSLLDSFGLGELTTTAPASNSNVSPTKVAKPQEEPENRPITYAPTPPPVNMVRNEDPAPYNATIDPKVTERNAKIEARRKKNDQTVSWHLFKKNIRRYVVPTLLALIILLLLSSIYVFRDRLFQIKQQDNTIDSSILLEKEALKSLSDTLQDIQQNPTPPVKKVAPVISESPSYEDDTAGGNVDIVSSSSADQIYYCVASGSFRSEAEAFEEKRNLDLIGFTGDVIEIKNGTRFQVIIGRYESYEKAVTELKFAKSIDKRFYLLTVKPYRK